MKLEIIIGDREYLRPRRIRRERVERMARRISPDAVVPLIPWATGDEDPYCDEYLMADPAATDERALLLLEYLQDIASPDAVICVMVPFSTGLAPDPTRLFDPRAHHFVALAQKLWGTDSVGCTRFTISANTQAVLESLRHLKDESSPRPDAVTIDTPPSLTVGTIHVQTKTSRAQDFSEMWANYTRAVLALAEPLAAAETIFGGRGRPDIIAEHLEKNQLLIRPEVSPERVLAELSPGGGLHALFSSPLPLPVAE